jgi:RNase P subunit RPR2
MSREVAVVKEAPSNFCHKCRRWIESNEKAPLFATVDGVRQPVTVWTCAECRGEGRVTCAGFGGPVTQADISKDERLGPKRRVERIINPDAGKSQVVELVCGHKTKVPRDMKVVRCRQCRKAAVA